MKKTYSELYVAIIEGELDKARDLIKNGAEPNIKLNPELLFLVISKKTMISQMSFYRLNI